MHQAPRYDPETGKPLTKAQVAQGRKELPNTWKIGELGGVGCVFSLFFFFSFLIPSEKKRKEENWYLNRREGGGCCVEQK